MQCNVMQIFTQKRTRFILIETYLFFYLTLSSNINSCHHVEVLFCANSFILQSLIIINKIINFKGNNILQLKRRPKLNQMQTKGVPFKNTQNLTLDLRNFRLNNSNGQKSPNQKSQNVDATQNNILTKKSTFSDLNTHTLEVNSIKDSSSMSEQSQIDIDEQNDIVNDLDAQYNLKNLRTSINKSNCLTHKQRVFRANCNKIQGNNFFKQNNFEDSIDQYKEGLVILNPEQFYDSSPQDFFQMSQLSSNILFNMGTCYFVLMSYKQAIKYYNQSILIKPTYVKAIQKRAQAKFQLGRYHDALIDIQNAQRLDSTNASILIFLKKIQEKLDVSQNMSNNKNQLNCKFQLQKNKKINQGTQSSKNLKNLSQSMILDRVLDNHQFLPKSQQKNIIISQINHVNHVNHVSIQQSKKKQRYSLSPQPIKSKFKQTPIFTSSTNSKNFYKLLVPKKKYIKIVKPTQHKNKSVLMQSKHFLFKQEENNLKKSTKSTINRSYQESKNKKDYPYQCQIKNKKQESKMWNFVPFAVVTGIGLYHGVKSFLGK